MGDNEIDDDLKESTSLEAVQDAARPYNPEPCEHASIIGKAIINYYSKHRLFPWQEAKKDGIKNAAVEIQRLLDLQSHWRSLFSADKGKQYYTIHYGHKRRNLNTTPYLFLEMKVTCGATYCRPEDLAFNYKYLAEEALVKRFGAMADQYYIVYMHWLTKAHNMHQPSYEDTGVDLITIIRETPYLHKWQKQKLYEALDTNNKNDERDASRNHRDGEKRNSN